MNISAHLDPAFSMYNPKYKTLFVAETFAHVCVLRPALRVGCVLYENAPSASPGALLG